MKMMDWHSESERSEEANDVPRTALKLTPSPFDGSARRSTGITQPGSKVVFRYVGKRQMEPGSSRLDAETGTIAGSALF
jgi:hypothetical protein